MDINGLSFSNGTFMRRGDVFITYHTTSVATALECVQNKFKYRCIIFQQNRQKNLFVNSMLNSNPHMMFLLWLTPSINKFFSETFYYLNEQFVSIITGDIIFSTRSSEGFRQQTSLKRLADACKTHNFSLK